MDRKLILVAIIVLLFNNCKNHRDPCHDPTNPICENYDPCYGKIATADFYISQYDGWVVDPKAPLPENCDTVLSNGASFNAIMDNATRYSWKIGSDARSFPAKTFGLLFDDYIKDTNNLNPKNKNYYKPISISLNVYNKVGGCINVQDTFRSRTKDLVFATVSPWLGTFRGVCDNDGKERVINIYRFLAKSDPLGNLARIAFVNLPNLLNKDTILLKSSEIPIILSSFKQFWWDIGDEKLHKDLSGEYAIDGLNYCKIFIQPITGGKDYLKIEYKYVSAGNQIKNYIFTGIREK